MIPAGLDPSSAKLAVVVGGEAPAAYVWNSPYKRWQTEACLLVHQWVCTTFGDLPPGLMFVESPVVGRGGAHATIVQAFTSGAAQAALLHLGWDVRLVNVARWKSFVTGHGNADKDAVKRELEQAWPAGYRVAGGDADLIDAAAIACYAESVIRTARHLLDEQGGV